MTVDLRGHVQVKPRGMGQDFKIYLMVVATAATMWNCNWGANEALRKVISLNENSSLSSRHQ